MSADPDWGSESDNDSEFGSYDTDAGLLSSSGRGNSEDEDETYDPDSSKKERAAQRIKQLSWVAAKLEKPKLPPGVAEPREIPESLKQRVQKMQRLFANAGAADGERANAARLLTAMLLKHNLNEVWAVSGHRACPQQPAPTIHPHHRCMRQILSSKQAVLFRLNLAVLQKDLEEDEHPLKNAAMWTCCFKPATPSEDSARRGVPSSLSPVPSSACPSLPAVSLCRAVGSLTAMRLQVPAAGLDNACGRLCCKRVLCARAVCPKRARPELPLRRRFGQRRDGSGYDGVLPQ